VEQYTASEPSAPSLEQTGAYLDDFYEALVTAIATGRKKAPEAVTALIDAGPYTAAEALDKGLVDALVYPDEIEDKIEQDDFIEFIDLEDLPEAHSAWESPKKIAVLYVEGAINSGPSGGGGLLSGKSTGSATLVDQLEDAKDDDQVKAVVIRVDSPGGSSFASDEIHRAIARVKEEGKPVVVSMGGYAASGGYYVSANADAIWAEPTTITGSIGVFGGKFALGDAMSRFGVSTTQLWRGRNATIDSSTTPWDDVQRARMQALVDATYAEFKAKVAEGRNLTPEQVEEIARGHVWTGKRAAEIGLVDHLGGLDDAIRDARNRAGLGEGRQVQLVSYDGRGMLLEAVAPATGSRLTERAVTALFPRVLAEIEGLRGMRDAIALPHGTDAWLTPMTHPDEHLWLMDPAGFEVVE
jgi:protease-4